jgi:AcrR family transcriptional regulator
MPKTKEQCEKIKQERMEQIYKEALRLFAIKGYEAVTADEIATAVGCSHGLLFHYFTSKEDLFQETVNNLALKLDGEITKNVNFDQGPKDLLQNLLDAYLFALKSSRDDYACAIYLLLNLWIQSKNLSTKKQKEMKYKVFDSIYDIVKKGVEEKEFIDSPPADLVITIMSILKGLSYNRINLGYNKCIIPESQLIMRMILN